MSLHFPNARLLIQDLITSRKLSGSHALAKAAHEYGLIPFDAVPEFNRLDCRCDCQCMTAACQILDKHFQRRNERTDMPRISLDQVRSAFERDSQIYKKKSGRFEKECKEAKGNSECAKLAPALFDLMLQQVRRYP
jgi:hypothetical protein